MQGAWTLSSVPRGSLGASNERAQGPPTLQSLRFIDLEEVLRLTDYPVIGFDRDGVIRWATAAGEALIESRGLAKDGQSAIGADFGTVVPCSGQHLRAWLEGELYAVDFELLVGDGATRKYLAVPLGLPEASGVRIAVLLLPPAIAGAGIESLLRGSPSETEDLDVLTSREREIAAQMLAGSRTTLIAEELGISVNTVRNHLKAIFRKLKVRSQADLVRMLRRRRGRA